jgi:hypothetical protein
MGKSHAMATGVIQRSYSRKIMATMSNLIKQQRFGLIENDGPMEKGGV